MNTPLKTRVAALLASLSITLVVVVSIADYGLPQAPDPQLAQTVETSTSAR